MESTRRPKIAATPVSRLASVLASPGRAMEFCHLFRRRAARDLSGPRPEPTQSVSVVEMSLAETVEKVLACEIIATIVLGLLIVSGIAESAAGCV